MLVIKNNIIIVALFVLTFPATYCQAGINGMQVDYFKDYELPLRWDNIEKSSQLVTGPEPQYNTSFGMHTFDLTPGRVLKIVIPEHEMLRIYFPMSCIPKEDLKISLSNGTGLHSFLPVSPDADNQSLLVKPSSSNPTVCRIFLPRCYSQVHGDYNEQNPCFPVALFLSRKEMPPQIAPYRNLIPLSGTPINLVHKKSLEQYRFGNLKPKSLHNSGSMDRPGFWWKIDLFIQRQNKSEASTITLNSLKMPNPTNCWISTPYRKSVNLFLSVHLFFQWPIMNPLSADGCVNHISTSLKGRMFSP